MEIETKFLRFRQPPTLGERIDGWRVCWLGGWDRGRVFFVVMVERKPPQRARHAAPKGGVVANRPVAPVEVGAADDERVAALRTIRRHEQQPTRERRSTE